MHYYRVEERKRVMMMEKVTHINDWIASLPRPRKRRMWNVVINGTVVQGVSASDDRQETAERYIASKYPGQAFTLVYTGWRISRHQ